MPPAVAVSSLTHRYGDRVALREVDLEIAAGVIFGLLGPNGSGKSTLFKLLCTLLPVQSGSAQVLGFDVAREADQVRALIGVTFQAPSLDPKLPVGENLLHHGRLFGLYGRALADKTAELLDKFDLSDRRGDRVDALSGGLKRRVEIAKALMSSPRLLLLDEPSTGLDPAARLEVWKTLTRLRSESGTTVLVTTHLMDEAERCDQLAILDQGRLVARGGPHELRASIGADCVTIPLGSDQDGEDLARRIRERFQVDPQRLGDGLRVEHPQGHELLRELVAAFPNDVRSVTLGKPTLEDVFIRVTGRRFADADEPLLESKAKKR